MPICGTAATMPISFEPTFSSLCVTMMSSPTPSAAVFSPRWLTFQLQIFSPVLMRSACIAPSLPPENSVRMPFTVAM